MDFFYIRGLGLSELTNALVLAQLDLYHNKSKKQTNKQTTVIVTIQVCAGGEEPAAAGLLPVADSGGMVTVSE